MESFEGPDVAPGLPVGDHCSTACERLCSIAGLVFSPLRARLNSSSFENQLLLKMNRKFVDFT